MPAPSSHNAAHWLRSKGWSIDCGMWIFEGDKLCRFTLEAAIARQNRNELKEAGKAFDICLRRMFPDPIG